MELMLLEESQIFGNILKLWESEFNQLSVIEKYGTQAAITDFAILLGGYVDGITVNNSRDLKDRTGWYWTKTEDYANNANVVCSDGVGYFDNVYERDGGCRPYLPFSSISWRSSNKVASDDGILILEYGEYPQYAVSSDKQRILESLYNLNSLNSTGKTYTTDSRKCDDYDKGFSPKVWDEYEYNGRKFVRVIANFHFGGNEFNLSNGEKYKEGDAVWVEVSPIKWMIDDEEDIAISERILIAGIQFNKESNYEGDFNKTDMYNFLNTYLVKDIIPSELVYKQELNQIYNRIKQINSMKLELEKERLKLEEKLIKLTVKKKIKM